MTSTSLYTFFLSFDHAEDVKFNFLEFSKQNVIKKKVNLGHATEKNRIIT